jgi:hypothetical protein
MNRDYVEMLAASSAAGADYLVVGAHALSVHGRPRATGDLDRWVRPTQANAARAWAALERFGALLGELARDDLASEDVVYQIGVAPDRIESLTTVTGLTFDEAWTSRATLTLEGVAVPVIGRDCLIKNKKALGKPRDLADVAELEGSGP